MNNTQTEVIEILTKTNAIMPHDHFVGTSGKHFDTYINKDALFPHTKETARIGQLFAEAHAALDIDTVAAPAMGGIILSQWTAYYLSEIKKKEIVSVYAEKKDGGLAFTRGYDAHIRHKRVLIIEDMATTGRSLKTVIDLVQKNGGTAVAASVMVNKNKEVTAETFGIPFTALAVYKIEMYDPDLCILCKKEIPVNTTIGHGKAFVEKNKQV